MHTYAKILGAAVLILAAGLPAQARKQEPPVLEKPFNSRALLSATTLRPANWCPVAGIGMNGVALDVRDGTFDGMWWHSMCMETDRTWGQWYIFYITGQLVSTITGTWAADQVAVEEDGVTYTGTFLITQGFGPWDGISGSGKFTMLLGPQQWIALDGEFVMPQDAPGNSGGS